MEIGGSKRQKKGDASNQQVRCPLQSFRPDPASTPPSLEAPLLSWGYGLSRSIKSDATSRIGYEIPLRPLPGIGSWSDLEVFAPLAVRRFGYAVGLPPTEFHSPTEYHRACLPNPPTNRSDRSHGVRSPSTLTAVWSPLPLGLPHPVRCAFRLSQPPSALLLQTPPGLISCR